jgi:hypothetical protein
MSPDTNYFFSYGIEMSDLLVSGTSINSNLGSGILDSGTTRYAFKIIN